MKKSIKNITESTISAILIAIIFFIWNDFFNNTSNLSGAWRVEDYVLESNYPQYEGMTLYFDVLLQQNGTEISGTAEKVVEKFKSGLERKIDGDERVRLEIIGTLKNNYFSKDRVTVHFIEHGIQRDTSTIMNLRVTSKNKIEGTFISTAADSRGKSVWKRK